MLADHLVDRTTKIQVDKIRLHPVHDRFRRLRHALRISAEQLDTQRALFRLKTEHLPRALVPMQNTIRRDKFGDQHVRPLLLAKPAKNRVCHARHRREVKGTHLVEPGKHWRSVSASVSVSWERSIARGL